jgi:hypothetical protein
MLSEIYYQAAIIDASGRGETPALIAGIREALTERGLEPDAVVRFYSGTQAENMTGNARISL